MGQALKNAKGEVIKDMLGKELCVGDIIFFPENVHSKGGRGEMRFGVVIGRDRYLQYIAFQPPKYRDILPCVEIVNKLVAEGHDIWKESANYYGLLGELKPFGWAYGITPGYVRKVSFDFVESWYNGSLFK